MTIVHEKPADDYDTFIQDGSILSKVRFIWRWQVIIIGTERKFPHQVMTSIVFNSVPIETTEDNWGTNPVLDRIKTVIRELKRWGNVMQHIGRSNKKADKDDHLLLISDMALLMSLNQRT